ncbi:MAG: hypothetical protein WBC04_03570 [Candidatus Acidiferrales bacterium]
MMFQIVFGTARANRVGFTSCPTMWTCLRGIYSLLATPRGRRKTHQPSGLHWHWRTTTMAAASTLTTTTALAVAAALAATTVTGVTAALAAATALVTTAATLAANTALLAPTTALVATAAAHGATAALATRGAGSQAIQGSAEAMPNRLPEVLASGNTAESNHYHQERVLGEIGTGFLAPQALE